MSRDSYCLSLDKGRRKKDQSFFLNSPYLTISLESDSGYDRAQRIVSGMGEGKGLGRIDRENIRIGALVGAPRAIQREVLEQLLLSGNHDRNRAYYGFLLHRINRDTPLVPLVAVLVALTNSQAVTQSRVDFVVTTYEQDPRPPTARLLRVMCAHAPPGVYVPPLGQRQARDAHIPLEVKVCACPATSEADARRLSSVNTRIYKALVAAAHMPDPVLAEIFAELLILSEQTGTVPLAVEQFVIEHASSLGEASVGMLAKMLRWWPPPTVQRLVDALEGQKFARKLVPSLWHLGPPAKPLIIAIADTRGSSIGTSLEFDPELGVSIIQFFRWIAEPPPAVLLGRLVSISAGGGLPAIPAAWACVIPDVCRTLQGEFVLPEGAPDEVKDAAIVLAGGEDAADVAFCVANSPWLGSAAGRTVRRMLAAATEPRVVTLDPPYYTPETLEPLGLKYTDICTQLLVDLRDAGIDIHFFLQPH